MSLALVATFGSLPEASVAFSSLATAGFHPIAGYNMNTPGISGGMAPSAYPLLVPEDELHAARELLAQLRHAFTDKSADPEDSEDPSLLDDGDDTGPPTTLGRVRSIVRVLVAGVIVVWIVMFALAMFRR